MQSAPRRLAFLTMLGLLGLLFLLAPWASREPAQERSYSQFVADVTRGQVVQAVIDGQALTATYASGDRARVQLPERSDHLHRLLVSHGVEIRYRNGAGSAAWSALVSLLLPLAFLGFLLWFLTGQGEDRGEAGLFTFGQSRARLYSPGDDLVTLADVAGLGEVKEELTEVIDFLRHPERYTELGARIPRGILLAGPPGTGKTLLARALAGEAGVPFYHMSGSDFVEIYAGVGAARVRDLFERARQNAPCIIFVDEIDAVARRRGLSLSGGSDEREQTLNQLLVEMDGFTGREGIIVIAATNRIDVLDPAVLRPGRFDRQIPVDPPDRQGRREILAVHARGKPLAEDVDLDPVAAMTTGFTGAELANLLNEAALLAARQRKRVISLAEITSVYERVVTGGPARRRTMSAAERRRVAIHEAGHAVISRQLAYADPIEKVTILPRGRALGYVMYRPSEDRQMHTRAEILDRIVALLGGRAAEEVLLQEVSTGASDDLERATALARRMVEELGMSPAIGPVSLRAESDTQAMCQLKGERPHSERTALAVDEAVRQLVLEGYERALALARRHRDGLRRVADALLERESLAGEELDSLLKTTG